MTKELDEAIEYLTRVSVAHSNSMEQISVNKLVKAAKQYQKIKPLLDEMIYIIELGVAKRAYDLGLNASEWDSVMTDKEAEVLKKYNK